MWVSVEDAAGIMKKSKYTGGRVGGSHISDYFLPLLVSSRSATVGCNEPPSKSGSEAPCVRVTPVASGNRTNVFSSGEPDDN